MHLADESNLLRRTLLAVGLTIGASCAFTGACLLVASLALDHAMPDRHSETLEGDAVVQAPGVPAELTSERSPRS